MARGFDLSVRLHYNGHPDLQRMFVRDLATVSRVEVLKGHYSILYGQGAPGATINYVGKRPTGSGTITASASLGNYSLQRYELDVDSGALAEGVHGRLVALDQRSDTWQPHVSNDRRATLAALSWAPAAGTSVRLEAEWMRNHRPFSFGTVYVDGRVFFDHSYVAPAATSDRRYGRGGLYVEHRVASDWSLHASYSAGHVNRDETLAGFFTIASPATLSSYYRQLVDRYRQEDAGIELRGSVTTGALAHRVSLGWRQDEYRFDFQGPQNIGGYGIDIDSPDLESLDFGALPLSPRTSSEFNREHGVHFQDRIAIGQQWHVVAGVRQARLRIDAGTIGARRTVADRSHIATALGAVYEPQPSLALHVSYSESYEPNRGADRFGTFIEPRESRQWEAGARLADGHDLHVAASAFDITQSNLTMPDPLDRTALVAVGSVRSRGLELAMQATPMRPLVAAAALTWQRVRNVVKTSAVLGDELAGVPTRFGHWGLRWAAAEGTEAWANVVFVGRRPGDLQNSFGVPGYKRLDLGAAMKLGALELSAQVANALDRRYVEAITAADNVYQGDRRRLGVTARYRIP